MNIAEIILFGLLFVVPIIFGITAHITAKRRGIQRVYPGENLRIKIEKEYLDQREIVFYYDGSKLCPPKDWKIFYYIEDKKYKYLLCEPVGYGRLEKDKTVLVEYNDSLFLRRVSIVSGDGNKYLLRSIHKNNTDILEYIDKNFIKWIVRYETV